MFSKLEKGFMKIVVPAPSFPEKCFKVFSKQEARFFPSYSTEELHQETEYGLAIALKSIQTGFVRSTGMSLQTVQSYRHMPPSCSICPSVVKS